MNGEIPIGTLVQCKGNTPNLAHRKFAGTVHTIRERAPMPHAFELRFGPAYHLDPPTVCLHVELMWDKDYLRILDDPSDDAVDQTLNWLPVPKTDETTT